MVPAERAAGHFEVSVCCALPDRQVLIRQQVDPGTTVAAAVEASGILQQFPEIERQTLKYGVFGAVRAPEDTLSPGERVEIYRPLTVDPKTARARRVAKTRAAGSREGRKWTSRDSR